MRILYLSAAKFPSQVSHTLSIMRMCQAFVDCGHEVLLTGRQNSADYAGDPITHYGLRGGFDVSLCRLGRVLDNRITRKLLIPGLFLALVNRRYFAEFRPDAVYSRLTVSALAAVPSSIPIIYEMHSLGPLGRGGLEAFVFRWLIRSKRFARIVTTTRGLAEALRAQFPNLDVVVARLSAERPVQIDEKTIAEFRNETLQGKQFSTHAGYTGYLDTIGLRGTDIICQAASLTPETAFHIVGGEQKVVEHWRQYAESYNQHGNIFFYGHRNPNVMPHFLACFDVALAPLQLKTKEGAQTVMGLSPLKLPQYMSYGKAIVASDLAAHREVLEHEKTALLVPAADAEAWSAAIRQVVQDRELRDRISRQARERYFKVHTPERRVEEILGHIGGDGASPHG